MVAQQEEIRRPLFLDYRVILTIFSFALDFSFVRRTTFSNWGTSTVLHSEISRSVDRRNPHRRGFDMYVRDALEPQMEG